MGFCHGGILLGNQNTHCHDDENDDDVKGGRDRLIEGSRGILQGTTAMLISFDASQVGITIIINIIIITVIVIITISMLTMTPPRSADSKSHTNTILLN